jgi:hypothetical protein
MKMRLGGTNSSLFQRNARQIKSEQNRYFDGLRKQRLERPAKTVKQPETTR